MWDLTQHKARLLYLTTFTDVIGFFEHLQVLRLYFRTNFCKQGYKRQRIYAALKFQVYDLKRVLFW